MYCLFDDAKEYERAADMNTCPGVVGLHEP